VEIHKLSYATALTQSCARTTRQQLDLNNYHPLKEQHFFHSLRAHLQVLQWKALSTDVANPCEWDWKMSNNILTPVLTDERPGPDDLLNVIRCKCKMTTKNLVEPVFVHE